MESLFRALCVFLMLNAPGWSHAASIASGAAHTCAMAQDDTVACWGYNGDGELGTGMIGGNQGTPQAVVALTGATALTAGTNHTCALRRDGAAACWGYNSYRQLGFGDGDPEPIPQTVPGLGPVVALSAGGYHICALRQDFTVVCWGRNDYGQIGIPAGDDQPTPQTVAGLFDVVAISAGSNHTCALRRDGAVACWGDNSDGQLGTGAIGDDQPTPQPVSGLTQVVALSAGSHHTCALQRSGTVACWGYNSMGQLGTGVSGNNQPTPPRRSST
jgi:alpha-tubulin suppressor-like RCC1 family protein